MIVILMSFYSFHVFADNESLYVEGFNSVNEQWDETGTSPWLNDNTANYISTSTDEKWHEEFTFANSGVGTGTINSVNLYVEINGPSARNDYVVIDLNDGSSWANVANQDPDGDAYVWYNYDVSGILNTWAKIDLAKLRVQYQRAGSPGTQTIYVRRSYIYIDYSVAGQNYVADVSQSISSTQSVFTQTDYIILPSQNFITSWNVLTQWNIIADLTQLITSSWSVLSSHNMFVELSQYINSIWQITTKWNTNVELIQTFSTSWNVLTRTTFNVINSLSNTFSFIVDVVHSVAGGVQHIVDLTQSISTTWIVDAYKGIKHSVNLTMYITYSWIVESSHSLYDPSSGSSGISLLLIITIIFSMLVVSMRRR